MDLFDLCPETGLAITPPMAVRPEMIDYNGHVNVAFYVKLFDEGLDILFERIGLSRTYVETRRMSFFALEAHVRYLREISLAEYLTDLLAPVVDREYSRFKAELAGEDRPRK